MDPFTALFTHAAPSARAFFAGNLCATIEFAGIGHLHVLQGGTLTLVQAGVEDVVLAQPTLLFFPRGRAHGFRPGSAGGADLVCATVDLGGEQGNPIGKGLPELVMLPLAAHATLRPICDLLVAEGFAAHDGRQAALDRLFEYLLILIVRHVVASGLVAAGVLAGLGDPRLAKALNAMHQEPRRAWSLEVLAEAAGMSRTRFAALFRSVIGQTPIDYLTAWRMTLARQLLAKGRPAKSVAAQVGYDSPAAFARVFTRVTGQTPSAAARAGAA